MKYRTIGSTGLSVSQICLGCMGLVGPEQTEKDSIATIHAAMDCGINFFDTARGYQSGKNEELLGRVIKGGREKVVIATKLNKLEPARISEQCEESLRRLTTDHIDLYQIHWPVRDANYPEALSALEKLRRQGKIRAIGVSNFGVSYLRDILATGIRVEANQLHYNLIWRPIEHELQPLCVENGVSILCYSALNTGLLTGKFSSPDEVPPERTQHRLFSSKRPSSRHSAPGCERELFEALKRVREIADSLNEPMSVITSAWLLGRPGVASIIAGARFPEQVKENVRASEATLSEEVTALLTEVSEPIKAYAGKNCDQWEDVSRMER